MNGRDNDYMFKAMVSEAMEEVAHKGWREADQNAVTLASFGLLNKAISNRMHSFTHPLWWATSAIGIAVITYVITAIMEA